MLSRPRGRSRRKMDTESKVVRRTRRAPRPPDCDPRREANVRALANGTSHGLLKRGSHVRSKLPPKRLPGMMKNCEVHGPARGIDNWPGPASRSAQPKPAAGLGPDVLGGVPGGARPRRVHLDEKVRIARTHGLSSQRDRRAIESRQARVGRCQQQKKSPAIVSSWDDEPTLVNESLEVLLGHLLAVETDRRMDPWPGRSELQKDSAVLLSLAD